MSNISKREKKAKEDAVKKQQQELDLFGYISDEDDIIPEFLETTVIFFIFYYIINSFIFRNFMVICWLNLSTQLNIDSSIQSS